MNLESKSDFGDQEQLSLQFPISRAIVKKSLPWLSYLSKSDGNLMYEYGDIRINNHTLGSFLDNMGKLRPMAQFSEYSKGYKRGAVFGKHLLQTGSTNPPLTNRSAINTYFKDLLIPDPDLNRSPLYNRLSTQPGGIIGRFATPESLLKALEYKEYAKAVLPIFNEKSERYRDFMMELEPGIGEFKEELLDRVRSNESEAFFYGITDVYWPLRTECVMKPFVETMEAVRF